MAAFWTSCGCVIDFIKTYEHTITARLLLKINALTSLSASTFCNSCFVLADPLIV